MTSAVEKHEQLIDAGWRCRLDGKWISPDPNDWRAWTFAAAWAEHRDLESLWTTRSLQPTPRQAPSDEALRMVRRQVHTPRPHVPVLLQVLRVLLAVQRQTQASPPVGQASTRGQCPSQAARCAAPRRDRRTLPALRYPDDRDRRAGPHHPEIARRHQHAGQLLHHLPGVQPPPRLTARRTSRTCRAAPNQPHPNAAPRQPAAPRPRPQPKPLVRS